MTIDRVPAPRARVAHCGSGAVAAAAFLLYWAQ